MCLLSIMPLPFALVHMNGGVFRVVLCRGDVMVFSRRFGAWIPVRPSDLRQEFANSAWGPTMASTKDFLWMSRFYRDYPQMYAAALLGDEEGAFGDPPHMSNAAFAAIVGAELNITSPNPGERAVAEGPFYTIEGLDASYERFRRALREAIEGLQKGGVPPACPVQPPPPLIDRDRLHEHHHAAE